MKILFLNPAAQLGGAERVLLDMIACLRATSEVEIEVVLSEDGPLVDELNRAGAAKVHVLPLPASLASFGDASSRLRMIGAIPVAYFYARRLRKRIAAVDPDIVHSNGLKMHLLSGLAMSRGVDRPLVWHIHDFLGQRRAMSRLLRRFARKTSVAIAISDAVAHDIRAILPETPVQTVLNAIDVEHFSPGAAERSLFGAASDGDVVRVGLVATYARWKGQDVFLDAAARVRNQDVRFYIVGGPIYATSGSQFSRSELEAKSQSLGVADRVEFVDFQTDPRDAFRSLDVVVHASTKPEPFGRTIVEAMACGRATIVSAAGGAVELFRDGVDALGVPPGDSTALAAAIDRLSADRGLRERLGSTAVATARARFDRGRLGPKLADIYRKLLIRR